MRYFGGKQRISTQLVKYIYQVLQETNSDHFYDLFCGSCNVISKIDSSYTRYANDIRDFMVSTMSVQPGFEFPDNVSKEDYKNAYSLPTDNPLHGFILVGCSFAGKYKGGYAKSNDQRNYAANAKRSLLKKVAKLEDVVWSCGSYHEVNLKENSVVYCDIPYHNTTGYNTEFDHDTFYQWVSRQKATILISEYEGSYNPLNLPTVWQLKSKKDIRSKNNERKETLEILRKFN